KNEVDSSNSSFSIFNSQFAPGLVGIGVGGAFDFITETKKRAPEWMQRLGLEWLHRLIQEPWRWRRQYWLLFVLQVLLKS
ncbi:MAG: WecB/TagA/CpsF family glycosyltransferase, partial [Chloroflexota bacterium]